MPLAWSALALYFHLTYLAMLHIFLGHSQFLRDSVTQSVVREIAVTDKINIGLVGALPGKILMGCKEGQNLKKDCSFCFIILQ